MYPLLFPNMLLRPCPPSSCPQDCGYVFTKRPAAWEKLGNSYGCPLCPLCGLGKNRFKKVPKEAPTKKGRKKGQKVAVEPAKPGKKG